MHNPRFFQKCCHFHWLCFDFSNNDNTFERNEDCATVFLKWTDLVPFSSFIFVLSIFLYLFFDLFLVFFFFNFLCLCYFIYIFFFFCVPFSLVFSLFTNNCGSFMFKTYLVRQNFCWLNVFQILPIDKAAIFDARFTGVQFYKFLLFHRRKEN